MYSYVLLCSHSYPSVSSPLSSIQSTSLLTINNLHLSFTPLFLCVRDLRTQIFPPSFIASIPPPWSKIFHSKRPFFVSSPHTSSFIYISSHTPFPKLLPICPLALKSLTPHCLIWALPHTFLRSWNLSPPQTPSSALWPHTHTHPCSESPYINLREILLELPGQHGKPKLTRTRPIICHLGG